MKNPAKPAKKTPAKDLLAKKNPKGGFISSFDPQPEPPGRISIANISRSLGSR